MHSWFFVLGICLRTAVKLRGTIRLKFLHDADVAEERQRPLSRLCSFLCLTKLLCRPSPQCHIGALWCPIVQICSFLNACLERSMVGTPFWKPAAVWMGWQSQKGSVTIDRFLDSITEHSSMVGTHVAASCSCEQTCSPWAMLLIAGSEFCADSR